MEHPILPSRTLKCASLAQYRLDEETWGDMRDMGMHEASELVDAVRVRANR